MRGFEELQYGFKGMGGVFREEKHSTQGSVWLFK